MIPENLNISDKRLATCVGSIREAAKIFWGRTLLQDYTDHGPDHSERIIDILGALLKDHSNDLNDYERFILLASAYLHDIGMQSPRHAGLPEKPVMKYSFEDVEIIRKSHNETSEKMIVESISPGSSISLGLERCTELANYIATISKYHRSLNLMDLKDSSVAGKVVKLPLLAALLRLGDELDTDYRRVNMEILKMWDIPPESKYHWWAHHYVQSVLIRNGTVELYFRFPEKYKNSKIVDTFHNKVIESIKKQYDEVYDILDKYGIRLYKVVKTAGDEYLSAGLEIVPSNLESYLNSKSLQENAELSDSIISPSEVFDRVHVDTFVGREWLLKEIDAFLNDNDCGYFVIEAKAGIGKTAFLAWLVRERNYINHFVELATGQEGIFQGLKNLASQLVLAYNLDHFQGIPDLITRQDFFYELLTKASNKLDNNEKIVLVVDALDEAGTPSGRNVLGLPSTLPKGVFFIVSQRPVNVILNPKCASKTFVIDAEDKDKNIMDIKSFLEKASRWPGVAQALNDSGYTSKEFIKTLIKKSQGIWIYLDFIIREIERGERKLSDLESLPDGLINYYIDYWSNKWRDAEEDQWFEYYLPLLTTLAASQEALTFRSLVRLAEIEFNKKSQMGILQTILNEKWAPFIIISQKVSEKRYRFYHSTLKDFFSGNVDRDNLSSAKKQFIDTLAESTTYRHKSIAERYLAAWGGLENGLPKLNDLKEIDEGYGIRYVTSHLVASGQLKKLNQLLALETGKRRNLWYETKDNSNDVLGYINDVSRAWNLTEELYNSDIAVYGKYIGLQNRYALIMASISSLSANIPPILLKYLVEDGVWSTSKGLAYSRQVPDPKKRIEMLEILSNFVEEKDRNNILNEALDIARNIRDSASRSRLLIEMVPMLSEPRKSEVAEEALDIAMVIQNDLSKSMAFIQIAELLLEPKKNEVIQDAINIIQIQDDVYRSMGLVQIAKLLPEPQKSEMIQEALNIARGMENELSKVKSLIEIASFLPKHQNNEVVEEALILARRIPNNISRSTCISQLAPLFSDPQKAISIAREVREKDLFINSICRIAPMLSEQQKAKVLQEALELSRKILDDNIREKLLTEIIPLFPDPQEALSLAQDIKIRINYINTVCMIVPRLPPHQRIEILREVVNIAREIRDNRDTDKAAQVETLSQIALSLSEPFRTDILKEALDIAKKIQNEKVRAYERALALSQIAPLFSDPFESLAISREIQYNFAFVMAISKIAPRLPEPDKTLAIQEAIQKAKKIRNQSDSGYALYNLINMFPDPQDAFQIAKNIRDFGFRFKAICQIIPRLPEPQKNQVLRRALNVARDNPVEKWLVINLAQLIPMFSEPQRTLLFAEAFLAAKAIEDEGSRSDAISALIPYFSDPNDALDAARSISSDVFRTKVLIEIVSLLPEDQKIDILYETLDIARCIQDDASRSKVFTNLAPLMPEDKKIELLKDALRAAVEIENEYDRKLVLSDIATQLAKYDPKLYYSIMPQAIRRLSVRRRKSFLSDLSSLMPIIYKLGGYEAIMETKDAIKDVGIWWI